MNTPNNPATSARQPYTPSPATLAHRQREAARRMQRLARLIDIIGNLIIAAALTGAALLTLKIAAQLHHLTQ
jgi:hypothetical protein